MDDKIKQDFMANKSNSLADTSSLEREIDGVDVWAVRVDGGKSEGGGKG